MWIRLGEALGVPREEMEDERHVLPGVRFATEAYVTFCKTKPWIDAVASSLTELFAPDLMRQRIAAFPAALPVGPSRGARLLQEPADAGAARQPARAAARADALHDGRDAAAGVRGAGLQARDAVGDDRHHPSRLPTEAVNVALTRGLGSRPRGGWRGSISIRVRQQRVLLYPEGVVLLNDTGAAILELVRRPAHPSRDIAAILRGAVSVATSRPT